jgi:hypothetical protein
MGIILTFVSTRAWLRPEPRGRPLPRAGGVRALRHRGHRRHLINTALFDWLRLSATRFYGEGSRAAEPALRATLNVAYLGLVGTLTALAAAAVLAGVDLGLPAALLAGAMAAGILNALFDYRAALARARFLDRAYAGLVLAKNAGAFALMVGGAVLTGDALWVLAGGCLSTAAAFLPARRALRDPAARPACSSRRFSPASRPTRSPIVLANAAYQASSCSTAASPPAPSASRKPASWRSRPT